MDGSSKDSKPGGFLVRPLEKALALDVYPPIIKGMMGGYILPIISWSASGLSPVVFNIRGVDIYVPVSDYRKMLDIVMFLNGSPYRSLPQDLGNQIIAEIKRRF